MSLINKIQTAFTGGELSPSLWNRPDLAKHQVGAKSLKNCFVHVEGGASNRPGTRFVHDLGVPGVFIPFEFNDAQTYMLCFYEEAGQGKLMFLTGGAVVVDGASDPYIIDSPYAYADLAKITFAQQFDTIVFRHPDYDELQLVRYGHADWQFEDRVSVGGPYLIENTDLSKEISLSAPAWDSATAYTVGDVVQPTGGVAKSITAASYEYWYKISEYKWYLLRLVVGAGHGFSSGDQVYVDSLAGVDHDFAGSYSIIRSGSDYIDINTGRFSVFEYIPEFTEWYNDYALPTSFAAATVRVGSSIGFYVSIQDGTNNALPVVPAIETAYWRRTYSGFDVVLESNVELFSAEDVGRGFRLRGKWSSVTSGQFVYNGGVQESDIIPAFGNVNIETGGSWGGLLTLSKSLDDGQSWEIVAEFDGLDGGRNHLFDYEVWELGAMVKVRSSGWADTGGSNELNWSVRVDNGNRVPLEITSFTDAWTVTAQVASSLKASFTSNWFEFGAFGGDQGQPGAVTIFQQRMFHARTNGLPMALWGSQSGNYTNHSLSNLQLDTEAIELDLSLSKQYEIRHLIALKSLLVLTSGSWHSVAGVDGGITPTNAEPTLHGYGGVSASVAPLVYGMSVLMVKDDDRSVSELRYSLAADGYDRTELDVMSKHLFRGKTVTSWAKQEDPGNLVWVVMSDGSLLCFTFLREQEVWAWTPCDTQGEFLETGSVKSPAGGADEVYFLTKRTVGGQDKYYIETLTDRDDGIFLDSSLTYEGVPATVISGLDHLEGLEVVALADGVVVRGHVVAGGAITLAVAASVVHVGLGMTSRIATLPLDLGESMSSAGRKKAVRKVVAYVADSKGFKIGPDETRLTAPKEWAQLGAGELFSGEIEHRVKGDWKTGGGIVIEQSDPLPMSIQGVVPFMEIGE